MWTFRANTLLFEPLIDDYMLLHTEFVQTQRGHLLLF